MTTTQNASPAEVLTEVIDQTRYELVQEIRRMGDRVQRAIADMEEIAASARRAVETGMQVMGLSSTTENPTQILRDMEPLIRTAKLIGVPDQCIADARRGEFVSVHDYITPR